LLNIIKVVNRGDVVQYCQIIKRHTCYTAIEVEREEEKAEDMYRINKAENK
jgi:hypothetical protein